eukprot:6342149-Prymnesium_polylepis.1
MRVVLLLRGRLALLTTRRCSSASAAPLGPRRVCSSLTSICASRAARARMGTYSAANAHTR